MLHLKLKINPAKSRKKIVKNSIIVDVNLQSVDDSIAPLGILSTFFGKTGIWHILAWDFFAPFIGGDDQNVKGGKSPLPPGKYHTGYMSQID